jgi:hypothetical protein
MEFDEMKKIWDSQNNETLYAINEKSLHDHIVSKKQKAYRITNFSELLLIVVNSVAGGFILALNFPLIDGGIFMYLLSVWMLGSVLFLLLGRFRRIRGDNRFDGSMHDDLHQAISVATYQVRLSQLMRCNILPIGLLSFLSVWQGGKSIWIVIGMLIFFAFAYYAGNWEHQIYELKKRDLEILKDKLENETSI